MGRCHSHTLCQIIRRLITMIVTVFPIHIIWLFDKNLRTLGQSTCHKGRIKYWFEKFFYIVWWNKVLTSLFPFQITVIELLLNHLVYYTVVKLVRWIQKLHEIIVGRFCEEMRDLLSGHMICSLCLSCYEFYMSIFVQIESF